MLKDYYGRRAAEYEEIYRRQDPVAQSELTAMATELQNLVQGRNVLEVACGTGYWTELASQTALHVTAVDASPEMLAEAAGKALSEERVTLTLGDAYDLGPVGGEFDAGIAFFWLSHVPAARMDQFLHGFHARLEKGAKVLLADNVYVPGLGGELIRVSDDPDTYKRRTLRDGTVHLVLKNYLDTGQLSSLLAPWASEVMLDMGQRYWRASYAVR